MVTILNGNDDEWVLTFKYSYLNVVYTNLVSPIYTDTFNKN